MVDVFEEDMNSVYVVIAPPNHTYGAIEGIYTSSECANKCAKICGGYVEIVFFNDAYDKIMQDKKVYTAGIHISKDEVMYTRDIKSISHGPENEDYWYEPHPERDALFMYCWAKDDEEAEDVARRARIDYLESIKENIE